MRRRFELLIGMPVALAAMVGGIGPFAVVSSATAQDAAAETVAVQVRKQGHACDKPQSAERDQAESKPDHAVWILQCENAKYRVKLTPDMAADVEQLD